MESVVNYMSGFSTQTIISMAAMMWIFKNHIDTKLDKLEQKMEQQSARSDRLYDMFIDLRKENEQSRKEIDQKFREMDQKFYDMLKEGRK